MDDKKLLVGENMVQVLREQIKMGKRSGSEYVRHMVDGMELALDTLGLPKGEETNENT